MSNISKIQLPDGEIHNIDDETKLSLTGGTVTGPVVFNDSVSIDEAIVGDLVVNGASSFINGLHTTTVNGGHPVYFIKGTQTSSTNLWTGLLPDGVTYYNGLTIDYLLPYAGTSSAATLNLSNLGAKPVYYGNSATGATTTHYGANTVIHLTYVIDAAFNSGNGCWKASNYYDSNTVSQLRWDYTTITAGTAGIFPYTLIMMNTSGNYESIVTSSSTDTSKSRNTVGFVPGTLLTYYASGTTTSGNKVSGSNYGVYEAYTAVDFRYSANISTSALTVGKPVFLVGTITNGLFYLDSTWWTQTLPTSDNGKVYMFIGMTYNIYSASTEYRVNLAPYHPMYWYKNGALRQYGGDASTINGKSATASATTGISIAAHNTGTVTGVQSTTTTASKVTVGSSSTDYGVKSAGSASTWTFEEKSIPNVTSAGTASSWTFEEKTIPNVTAAGSGSASLTFTMDTTDTKKLKIAFSHTHTAPTIGTAIKVQSKSGGSNGTAPTLGTAIKVQSKSGGANSTAPTLGSKVPTVSASDVTVPIKNASASTFVTGTTHTVTDNGHTHSI